MNMPFDPETFMNQTVDQSFETELQLPPEGDYSMVIDDFDNKALEMIEFEYKKGARAGTKGSMLRFTVPFRITDENIKAQYDRPDGWPIPTQLILDTDETGGLAWGPDKNVGLGRLRTALGQNQSGAAWGLPRLRGAGPLIGRIRHVTFERKDGSKGKRAEVSSYAPAY